MAQDQGQYDELRAKYDQIVDLIDATSQDFRKQLAETDNDNLAEVHGYSAEAFDILRERADSELLSIAFFGAFSSGKSFLVSGLVNRVDIFSHEERDAYAPILPASSRATSSCPVAVEPAPKGKKKDRFWVWFKGSRDWEEKRPAIEAIIQAYVTDLPHAKAKRLTNQDRMREVTEAKLVVVSPGIHARLYDLPGIGAVDSDYEDIVRGFVKQTDCLVYVSAATKPMDATELDLLRHVYNHHRATGKPVFFVLTQIDKNWDYEASTGDIGWKVVLEANNEFLDKHFVNDRGVPDKDFIGSGFVPISAALEAKSRGTQAQNTVQTKRWQEDSNMMELRNRFGHYLHTTSGPMHLSELALEMQRLLARMGQDLVSQWDAIATPLQDARNKIRGQNAQRNTLIEGKARIRKELQELGESAINRAFDASDSEVLTSLLRKRLRTKIQHSNVLKYEVIHNIESAKAEIVREWATADETSLLPRWERAWEDFSNQADVVLERLFVEAHTAFRHAYTEDDTEDSAELDDLDVADRLPSRYPDPRPETVREAIDLLSTSWKTWSVVATAGASTIASSAAVAATVPAMTVLGPIGWGLMVSALFGTAYGMWRNSHKLNDRRQQMIIDLRDYAELAVGVYRDEAHRFVNKRVALATEFIDQEIDRLNVSIHTIEQKLLTGEYIDRDRRLAVLERLRDQCDQANDLILDFYGLASRIQPDVAMFVGSEQ